MKYLPYFSLSVFILLISCNLNQESKEKETLIHSDTLKESEDHRLETSLPKELSNSILVNFSSDSLKDKFEIIVPKGPISKTKTTFRISDSNGNSLFEDHFETKSLINGYALQPGSSTKQTDKYIEERIKLFFENSFIDPTQKDYIANSTKEEFENYEVWQELKPKENAIAFVLPLEEEYIRYLAYSQRLNKVVVFFACC